ncbi:MAG: RNA polymerase sigma factor [Bacteroidota bacterium]|jgi:RNA polymerase sigma-70 factor (ECF subfamily)
MKEANTKMTEEELLAGCNNGDNKCQYMLYKKFAPVMLAVCRRYASSLEEAEDVLQDGFIKIFNNLDKYRGDGSLEGWIRRIMVNTALNQYRSSLKTLYQLDVTEIQELIEDNRSTHLDKMNANVLLKMIETLPKGYKLIFNLYEIEGYAHKEIAEMLNISINTSKSQLLKARRVLQKKVEELTERENKLLRR